MPSEDASMLVNLYLHSNDIPSLEQIPPPKAKGWHHVSLLTVNTAPRPQREQASPQVHTTTLPPHSPQGGIRFGRRNKFLCLFQHTIDLVLSDPHVFQMQHADHYGSAIHTWRCCG